MENENSNVTMLVSREQFASGRSRNFVDDTFGGSPLAFGEGGVKGRIKNVLNFRKPSRVIIVASVALVSVLSVGNVSLNVKLKDSTTDLYIGDEILVSYDGMITET